VDGRAQTLEQFESLTNQHEEAIAIEGLEDLFMWASEMVADGQDPRARRSKEQKIRRNVLEIIQRNREVEAREKLSEELTYLQKRVIALLQIVNEKMEENASLKHIIVSQYFALSRIAYLEDEVKQLEKLTWYRDEAEAERKHMMSALSKIKNERDFLDEMVTVNENENVRLAKLLSEARAELNELQNRRWWHIFRNVAKKLMT
jgi:hypothetical protein